MTRFTASAAALVALGAVALAFSVSWSQGNSYRLPYSVARYSTADAKRAFAQEDVKLVAGSRSPAMTDLHDRRLVFEVTVFGAPDVVRKTGFRDLVHQSDCTVAGHLALRWRGNVRGIVNCDLVRADARWIAQLDRALANLP
jgi:hypothetical protein